MRKKILKTVAVVMLSSGMILQCAETGFIPNAEYLISAYGDTLTYEDFNYQIIDNSYVEISRYTGNDTEAVIPVAIDGLEVKSIGDNAFLDCENIVKVQIPDSVTSIGRGAFNGCVRLKEIEIPKGVTTIESDTFSLCDSLTKVTIPDGVTTIKECAFFDCNSLTKVDLPDSVTFISILAFEECAALKEIVIPKNVTYIGEEAFKGCNSLTSIIVDEANATYDSRNNCNAVIKTNTNELLCGCSSTVIPGSVKIIGESAFVKISSIKNINIPEGVTEIKVSAFENCSNLMEVTIPASVTKIDSYVFYGCSSLTSINVNEANTTYDSRNNCNAIIKTDTNELLYACQTTVIPESVTIIGVNAYRATDTLTKLEIPAGVTEIKDFAFGNCKNFKDVLIPDSVTNIGNSAFNGCSNLTIYCNVDSNASQWAIKHKFATADVAEFDKADNEITGTFEYTQNASAKSKKFTLDVKSTSGTCSFESDNSSVKVDDNGIVTIAANFVGKANITVTAGDSTYKKVTKTISITVLPQTTKFASVKADAKSRVILKWNKIAYVDGYQIQYSTDKTFATTSKVTVKGAKSTNKTIKKLQKGKKYYVRIRTYKKVSGKNYFSVWSAKKSVKLSK